MSTLRSYELASAPLFIYYLFMCIEEGSHKRIFWCICESIRKLPFWNLLSFSWLIPKIDGKTILCLFGAEPELPWQRKEAKPRQCLWIQLKFLFGLQFLLFTLLNWHICDSVNVRSKNSESASNWLCFLYWGI